MQAHSPGLLYLRAPCLAQNMLGFGIAGQRPARMPCFPFPPRLSVGPIMRLYRRVGSKKLLPGEVCLLRGDVPIIRLATKSDGSMSYTGGKVWPRACALLVEVLWSPLNHFRTRRG